MPASPTALNTSAVPHQYLTWVLRAGSMCTTITPAIISAQDQVESGWNPPAGAEGIAQFLPGTFATWGRDAFASQPSRTKLILQVIEPQYAAARACRHMYRTGHGLSALRDHQHMVRHRGDGLADCAGLSRS